MTGSGIKVGWSHSVLRVRDLDAMIDFYCDALGFELADRGNLGPDTQIAFLSGSSKDHHQLGLMTGRTDKDDAERNDQALDHMAFRVVSVDDVRSMVNWISDDERISDGFPVTHGNAISVYFSDPEGNGVEVFCDTPWHVPQPQVRGWDPAQSSDEVLAGVRAQYMSEAGFTSITDYQAERAQHFGQ